MTQVAHNHGNVDEEGGARVLEFAYENWRGDEHVYVVDFGAGPSPGPSLADVTDQKAGTGVLGGERTTALLLSGWVVTRDGNDRPEMGDNRRRSFEISKMRDIKVWRSDDA